MNTKKFLPILLLIVMAVLTITIRRCNTSRFPDATRQRTSPYSQSDQQERVKFDRSATDLFFSKHARCRMECRHITQQEVKDILINGTINYNKSNLNDPRGPTYALEGRTKYGEKIRIIFAPKREHMTVVTVIDLEREFECNCN